MAEKIDRLIEVLMRVPDEPRYVRAEAESLVGRLGSVEDAILWVEWCDRRSNQPEEKWEEITQDVLQRALDRPRFERAVRNATECTIKTSAPA